MKHLIKDTELMDYLNGNMKKDDIKSLKKRLEENGELNMLYHLKLAHEIGVKEYADSLIGEDTFTIEQDVVEPSNRHLYIAANKTPPKKF